MSKEYRRLVLKVLTGYDGASDTQGQASVTGELEVGQTRQRPQDSRSPEAGWVTGRAVTAEENVGI